MHIFKAAVAFAAIGLSVSATAQQQTKNEPRLADHPAVTAKRLSTDQGYDYASKFYPHPAWLHLYLAPPDEIRPDQANLQLTQAQSVPGEATARR